MKYIVAILAFFSSVFLFSCIEIIDFNINENSDQIVIIGSITTEPGPYEITITKASDFYTPSYVSGNEINDARVSISSDDGQVEELSYTEDGVYVSRAEGIRGEVGRSYTLTIITANNEIYQSSSELITQSPSIDSLYIEYQEVDEFENGIVVTNKYANLLVDLLDDPNAENYYSWTWDGTYQFSSNPELFTTRNGGPPVITPLPCSFGDCSCCTCWLNTPEKNDLALSSDLLFNGNIIKKLYAGTVPITPRSFQYKYLINVKQKTLSKKGYDFWQLIKDQASASTILATPPAQIIGNISNINNPSELVWGFFSASDVVTKSFYLSASDIPNFNAIQTDTIRNDCRTIPGATTQTPPFWE
ncbi:MAG: DUF4249 domain-containing protein [Reichenbachiella sp.]